MKKVLIIIIIAIILIIAAGIVCYKLGFTAGEKSMEQIAAQYKKVIDYHMPVTEEMFSLSGKITEIEGNVLSVKTTIQDSYKLPEEWETKIIKIIVTDETKFTKFDIHAEEGIEINVSGIKVGDQLSASAAEDIKDKTEFTAESIEVYENPEMPEEIPETD